MQLAMNTMMPSENVVFWTCAACATAVEPFTRDLYDDSALSWMQLIVFMCAMRLIQQAYEFYLESVYEKFPQHRIPATRQVPDENIDPCGRTDRQMQYLERHQAYTVACDWAMALGTWYVNATLFWPGWGSLSGDTSREWAFHLRRSVMHLYVLSFFMYWMHRMLHVVPWAWKHIHSVHHWAYRPLSRVTFHDHVLDNVANAVVGNYLAQVLVPLGFPALYAVRLMRLLESLEKHSGLVGAWNITYTLQSWAPCVQQPHHHDWHHQGHKTCNYSFSALGGIWDVVFGTRYEPKKTRQ